MRQRPRDARPGLHHVNLGAAQPELYFRDDLDHVMWLRRFVRVLDARGWTCVSFVALSTHWHALLDVPDDSLPLGMHYLNSEYGKDFNARHGRSGALVRARYWSRPMTSDADAAGVFAYLANNPRGASLAERPEDWFWSSFATTIGVRNDFPFVDGTLVLAQFGSSPAAATAALRAFVDRQYETRRQRTRPF